MWAQPALYQLLGEWIHRQSDMWDPTYTKAEDQGDFPAGTVLASGNSAGNKSTNIDLYASADLGHSWEFVSNIAKGGRPNTTNGADPIWEPWIM
jgi:hypothetical protein